MESEFEHGVTYKTTLSINDLEEWLSDNCTKDWKILYAGFEGESFIDGRHIFDILFKAQEDKTAFKFHFSSTNVHAPQVAQQA